MYTPRECDEEQLEDTHTQTNTHTHTKKNIHQGDVYSPRECVEEQMEALTHTHTK